MTIKPLIAFTEADSRFLYNLSQDESVRSMSTRSELFTYDEHCRWLKSKLESGLNRIWIMEVEGIPVAQVRYGKVEGSSEAEIAISVSPTEREKGYALELLKQTEPWAREWLEVTRLVALVITSNQPSQKLFAKAGYRLDGWVERMGKQHRRYVKP